MKFTKFLFLLLLIAVVGSCHNENPSIINGKAKIISISTDSAAIGDTVIIRGEFLGVPAANKFLRFDTNLVLNSQDVILWHNNEIKFEIPINAKSTFIYLIDDKILLDSIFIGISPVPFLRVVEIASGQFIRGSESSSTNESPAREIRISKSMFVTTYEVSQRIYEAVTGENPSRTKSLELPVENVEWRDAVDFCNRLSILHGLEPVYRITGVDVTMSFTNNGWRLPTEAEWEYICRSGTSGDYSGNGNLADMAWYGNNSGLKMHPPAQKMANQFGVYDIHGNLWEWCWDFYDSDYYEKSTDLDPLGPDKGERRVMRGGSWNDGANFARSSNRNIPSNDIKNVGIRLVRNK